MLFSITAFLLLVTGGIADTQSLVKDLSFGSYGTGDGQFQYPIAIAISLDQMIYVADMVRSDIQVFYPNGTFIRGWGDYGEEDGSFLQLCGVAAGPDDTIYTLDMEKCQVQQFSRDGTFIRSFGSEGEGQGELNGPFGIAVNSTGYIYIADWGNNRVEIFSGDGQYNGTWNITTGMPADFEQPVSVAIDPDDSVAVGLAGNGIYQFKPDKTVIQSWDLPYRINDNPRIAFSPDGALYAIKLEFVVPGEGAVVYRCEHDGSVTPLPAGSDAAFLGIGIDAQSHLACTDWNGYCVVRYLIGTKTPALPVPHLVWSSPLIQEDTMSTGYGNFMTLDGGIIETGRIYDSYWPDMLVVKRDVNGAIEWLNSYGGSEIDEGIDIIETSDGNYLVLGATKSAMSGYHGNYDFWAVMLDPEGTTLWEQCYGGSSFDMGRSVIENNNGNFLLIGISSSNDGNVTGNHGEGDIWVVEIDRDGEIIQEGCYGGSRYDEGNYIIETEDGEYILTGVTGSDDGDVSGNHGEEDIWVVETDSEGKILWQRCYGGTEPDGGNAIRMTSRGGYILTGFTKSNDGDIVGNHGSYDLVGIGIDRDGTIEWQGCYGGSKADEGYDVLVSEQGYTFVGYTDSDDYDVTGYHGNGDAWVIQTDTRGNLAWSGCFGGFAYDTGNSGIFRGDGTYIITGETSSIDGDVADPNVHDSGVLWTFLIDEMNGNFSASVTSGPAPLTVAFTGWTSSGMEADSWNWYFGDGGISHEINPVHQYTAPGTYTVKMEVAGPGFDNSMEKPGYITVT
ncbi:MAG: PKD domain-containing protein [Methanospirillaceae archaeon]|nr:PKD domain-containing protein [Methanospirillaceae archaeon]